MDDIRITFTEAPHDKRKLLIQQHDGSVLAVPVMVIATNRAAHYKAEFGDNLLKSLAEDTLPLFAASEEEIIDWATNNMDWKDVAEYAEHHQQITGPYIQSHIRTRKWFKDGKTVIWNDSGNNDNAKSKPARTLRKVSGLK